MSGDVHAGFCEGRGVRLPPATHHVMGFQYRDDAERMRAALERRLRAAALELHPDKTRFIEFGRLPALRRCRCGERHPSTFAFLGFTHYCRWTRDGPSASGRRRARGCRGHCGRSR